MHRLQNCAGQSPGLLEWDNNPERKHNQQIKHHKLTVVATQKIQVWHKRDHRVKIKIDKDLTHHSHPIAQSNKEIKQKQNLNVDQ